MVQQYSKQLQQAFAPTGVIRAAINLGNPVLASVDPHTGEPVGVSVDLARGFAVALGLPLELAVFDSAGKSVAAVAQESADIGFFAIDPIRGASISFTAPYVLIEGSYLVRDESPLRDNSEVDVVGTRIVVGKGSASDLFLTRSLHHAQIVRVRSSPAVFKFFMEHGLDAAAGVRQQLEADISGMPSLRLLPGRFMVIQQAMGLPRRRGRPAAEALGEYIEEAKACGFVDDALRRHHITGALVAPPGVRIPSAQS